MALDQQTSAAAASAATDPMPLNGIDHVELFVGNALQAAYYYVHAFGFKEVAYSGLETGVRDRASHVLQQGRIRLVLTGTLRSGTEIAAHHARHGDGVKAIALLVPNRDPAVVLAVSTRLGLDPSGRVHDVAGGFLLKLERPST